MRLLLLVGLIWVLADPARALAQSPTQGSELAALMIGTYETAPDDSKNNFVDMRVALEPLGPGHWVYYQLNTGPDRGVYRQRVLQLTDQPDDHVLQTTWSLKNPEAFVIDASAPGPLGTITMADLKPALEEGCDQIWSYDETKDGGPWVGVVDPATCKIFSERRQDEIAIKAEARLSAVTLYQTEKGFDESGQQLFGDPEGQFIVLYRQP